MSGMDSGEENKKWIIMNKKWSYWDFKNSFQASVYKRECSVHMSGGSGRQLRLTDGLCRQPPPPAAPAPHDKLTPFARPRIISHKWRTTLIIIFLYFLKCPDYASLAFGPQIYYYLNPFCFVAKIMHTIW